MPPRWEGALLGTTLASSRGWSPTDTASGVPWTREAIRDMKNTILPALTLTAAVGLGLAFTPAQAPAQELQEKSLKERVESLEKALGQAQAQLDKLATERAAQKDSLVEIERALAAQGTQAASALGSLDEAENAGFLAGINPKSREHLLEGLRGYLGEAAKSEPAERTKAQR